MNKIIKIIIICITIIVISLGWYLISPIFIDKQVNEENPFEIKNEVKQNFNEIVKEEQKVTEVIKEEIGKDKINNSEENNESNLNF
jgi:hypothetical protein